jgi:hypothetical protein
VVSRHERHLRAATHEQRGTTTGGSRRALQRLCPVLYHCLGHARALFRHIRWQRHRQIVRSGNGGVGGLRYNPMGLDFSRAIQSSSFQKGSTNQVSSAFQIGLKYSRGR